MAGINNTILVGRLTRDPELRKTQTGQSVCTFTVAVDRIPGKDGTEGADFPSCVAWGKTAEILSQYGSKGSQIGVRGRLQTRNYEDKEGRKVYVTEVVADQVQLLGGGSQTERSSGDYMTGGGSSLYKDDLTGDALRDPESDDLPF